MLTERQQAIYDYILGFRAQQGCSPSIPEIQRAFGIKSPNGVAGHLKALEAKGYIQRTDRGSRSIDVRQEAPETVPTIPLIGEIAAGMPEAQTTHAAERCVRVDEETLGFAPKTGCFALRVHGDSMRDAGILPGDLVVVDPELKPKANQIVAALIDGDSTLKRLVQVNYEWFLKAENPAYPELHPRADLQIQGVVRTLIRQVE